MTIRKCYLLTCDTKSKRAIFSKYILEKVGFEVIFFIALPNQDKVLSNKESMMNIYDNISKGEDEWVYVFEDDINVLKEIDLNEIIEYENISSNFFYLGCCVYNNTNHILSEQTINNNNITVVKGGVRGLHAIGLSKEGAAELYNFAKNTSESYMDVILENFSLIYPANVIRYDLQSYIFEHRGIFFQDRKKFPTTI
jgi:hypothetical protein